MGMRFDDFVRKGSHDGCLKWFEAEAFPYQKQTFSENQFFLRMETGRADLKLRLGLTLNQLFGVRRVLRSLLHSPRGDATKNSPGRSPRFVLALTFGIHRNLLELNVLQKSFWALWLLGALDS